MWYTLGTSLTPNVLKFDKNAFLKAFFWSSQGASGKNLDHMPFDAAKYFSLGWMVAAQDQFKQVLLKNDIDLIFCSFEILCRILGKAWYWKIKVKPKWLLLIQGIYPAATECY